MPNIVKGIENAMGAVKDAKNAVSAFKTGNKRAALKHGAQAVKKGVKGIVNFVNHPEWYTNYAASSLVNLNFGSRVDLPVSHDFDSAISVPNVAVYPVYLCEPMSRSKITDPLTVDSGYLQGINQIYTALRSANSSTASYDLEDLRHYVRYAVACHAIYASVRRIYANSISFSAYDGRLPECFFLAEGLEYADFRANLANLKMFGNQLGLEIATKIPLKIPLIDRTRWMFSNLFQDSDQVKSGSHMFSIFSDNVGPIASAQLWSPISKEYVTVALHTSGLAKFDDFFDDITGIIKFFYDPIYADIAAEMLKAFGSDAVYPAEIWPDNMPTPRVYDIAALTQIQNMSGILGGVIFKDGIVQADYPISLKGYAGAGEGPKSLITGLVQEFINFNKDSATAGETLSAMRLAMLWEFTPQTTDTDDSIVHLMVHNTEIPLGVAYIGSDGTSTPNILASTAAFTDIYVTTNYVTSLQNNVSFCWAAFDWSPRLRTIVWAYTASNNTLAGARVVLDLWDWNNYAPKPAVLGFISYSSVANRSLLYVPTIVRQAKWTAVNMEN